MKFLGYHANRAQRIKDNELTIQDETDNQIKALIRNYHIVVDLENRMILHDCADWSRVMLGKRFCKHIGKLFLSLDEKKASNILKQIYTDNEAWRFKLYKNNDTDAKKTQGHVCVCYFCVSILLY